MKAIIQDGYGPPEVLQLGEVDKPIVGDDDVLVEVKAAGVDPGVWHLMTGLPYLVRVMGFGFRAPKMRVRGRDVAGVVEAVGKNVTQFKAGDEVYGICDGAFAEYVCATALHFAPKPSNLTFEQAASVPISAMTALHGLRDTAHLKQGQKALILGAAGGVGSFAVQIAKAFGAEVTGVCSTSKMELVRSIGADHVIDYTRESLSDETRRFDLILDTAGRRPLSQLARILAPRGILVIVGGEGGGRWLGGFQRQLFAPIRSLFSRKKMVGLMPDERQDDLIVLKELIEAGKLNPVVGKTYPLSQTAEAIRSLHAGQAQGKLVITLAPHGGLLSA
jgi:NADPH:quinone reductase-like Zn-dependent oxidoreductase